MSHQLRRIRVIAVVALLSVGLVACGGGAEQQATDTTGPVTLRYWLWDSAQLPPYEQCAADFTAQNPDINISLELYGWGDYWNNLTTSFAAGTAPDVFADHLARYPEFSLNEVLLPLNEFIERDNVDLDKYVPGLVELWTTPDGTHYGLPKDWDAVAIVFNADMLAEAGVSEDELHDATWNPDDGGTFEDIMARLAVDENGVRGDEPGFDADNVATYAMGWDLGSIQHGQTTWAGFLAGHGFQLLDKNPWGTEYNYDDPRMIGMFEWYQRMIEAGYMPPLAEAAGLGQSALFGNGTLAMAVDGSWTIRTYTEMEGIEVGFAQQPAGPEGSWTLFNGLSDGIWSGTQHPEEAWQWVKYLGSIDCQRVVGESAVVFPAIPEAAELAVQTHAANGVDVTPFTTYVEEGHTVLFPITDQAAWISMVVVSTIESIMLLESEPEQALNQVNTQVNTMLEAQS